MKKILVIRFSSLGDVLLTSPLLRSLKRKFPEAKIDFLVKENYVDAVRFNPNISEVLIFKKEEEKVIARKLKERRYDSVIDLQNNIRSKRIREKLGARAFVFKKPTLKKLLLVKFKINLLRPIMPIPERYVRSVEELEPDEEGLELYFQRGKASNTSGCADIIGLCPGSKHFTKMYPKQYFIELGNKFARAGYKVKILGGRDEIKLCEEISSAIPTAVNLSNNNDLFATAREMQNCKAVICNDSGLMHVAAAVKTPVVALFGSTVKEFGFAPYKIKSLILENNSLTCRPCSHIGREKCPKEHFKCMLELKPDLIFEKIKEFLEAL